jgi:hypothetical protein
VGVVNSALRIVQKIYSKKHVDLAVASAKILEKRHGEKQISDYSF